MTRWVDFALLIPITEDDVEQVLLSDPQGACSHLAELMRSLLAGASTSPSQISMSCKVCSAQKSFMTYEIRAWNALLEDDTRANCMFLRIANFGQNCHCNNACATAKLLAAQASSQTHLWALTGKYDPYNLTLTKTESLPKNARSHLRTTPYAAYVQEKHRTEAGADPILHRPAS